MKLRYLTFDAGDAEKLAAWWAELLGWELVVSEPGHSWIARSPGETSMLFLPVPEGKTAKNRCHPDIHTPDLERNVARALGMGAIQTARFDDPADRFVVFQDPEGNEFCIVEDAAAGTD